MTPGSTSAYASCSFTSSTRFIRRRLTSTEPRSRGAGPPYGLLRPCENVHSGTRCSFATRTTAWTSSTVSGRTTADAVCSSHPAYAYGSRNSRRSSSDVSTRSLPRAAANAASAPASPCSETPGGSTALTSSTTVQVHGATGVPDCPARARASPTQGMPSPCHFSTVSDSNSQSPSRLTQTLFQLPSPNTKCVR